MKSVTLFNRILLLLLLGGSSTLSFSQALKEVFNNKDAPLTYLGIDFTKTKFIGAGNEKDMRDRIFTSINTVVIAEPKKYAIASAFRKNVVNNEITNTIARNEKADADAILSTSSADFNRLKEADIVATVKGLDMGGKDGVGLLFVMEAMQKTEKTAYSAIWVTLVDMKTKKVLLTERIEAKATGGFGFRNYWASSIKSLLDTIEDKKFKEWKAKYSS